MSDYDPEKPYLTYSCQGRYKEPGAPWSEPGMGCAQTCDLRLLCYEQRQQQREQDACNG